MCSGERIGMEYLFHQTGKPLGLNLEQSDGEDDEELEEELIF